MLAIIVSITMASMAVFLMCLVRSGILVDLRFLMRGRLLLNMIYWSSLTGIFAGFILSTMLFFF